MIYSVIKHNYETNETKIMEEFTDISNAMFYVEEYITDYVLSKQGDREFKSRIDAPALGSSFKEGYFGIIYKDFVNKTTLYNRNRFIGWVYNSQVDEKHFDIFIASVKAEEDCCECCQMESIYNDEYCSGFEFKECLKELNVSI